MVDRPLIADHWAIVPAAGVGARMGGERPKQYLSLAGRPILLHTLERLARHPRVAGLVLVLHADDAHWPLPGFSCAKPLHHVVGGASRAASVLVALDLLAGQLPADAPLLVHDAVRPLLHASDLDRLCALPLDDHGCLLATPVADTVKRADTDGRVLATLAREGLYTVQTPQRFRLGLLRGALQAALASGQAPGDEAQAVELAGFGPRLVPGRRDNIKITTPQDLPLAECLLAAQSAGGDHDDAGTA